ncbi:hypothetical protein DPX16_10193 [Anabarilius grahami]|uniref:Uncharacterized protein n=1 Tax=Anabarilius grahami TaxID=495550 RepID=A0A3N0XX91_ANAGA|nr:hypothetical protein DPX16_10193 [Anabarilius grahami]
MGEQKPRQTVQLSESVPPPPTLQDRKRMSHDHSSTLAHSHLDKLTHQIRLRTSEPSAEEETGRQEFIMTCCTEKQNLWSLSLSVAAAAAAAAAGVKTAWGLKLGIISLQEPKHTVL